MIQNIQLTLIDADPKQPRQNFIATELEELKNSIAAKGILSPLIVESNFDSSGHYLLLDGERRYRCAKALGLVEVPVTIIAGPLSFEERTIIRFHVQEQHRNWTIFDRAKAIFDLKKESNLSYAEIAEKLNTTAPNIHHLLSITDLTEETQKEVLEKKISFSYLIHLVKITKDYLSFSDLTQREIEKKLIEKIQANVFKTVLDFQRFSRLMSTYTFYPEKLEFLQDLNMSLDEILKKTEIEKKINFENTYKYLSTVKTKILEIKNSEEISQEIKDLLSIIKEEIEEII